MNDLAIYYHSPQQTKQYNHLLNQSLFFPLVTFMYEHREERIILRQLKAAFATEAKLEQFLSEMIDCQLIIRENRQYRLNFPIYTAAEVASLPLAEDELPKFKGTVTEQLFWLAESFWPQVFPEEEDYFFGVSGGPSFYQKQRLASAQLSTITLEKEKTEVPTMPRYFDYLGKEEALPEAFSALYDLLGDVNPEYYLSQARRVIKQALRGRKVSTVPNIFQESLHLTQVITIDQDHLKLLLPVATEQAEPLEAQSDILAFYYEKIANRSAIERLVFMQQLIEQLGTNSLSYLRIN